MYTLLTAPRLFTARDDAVIEGGAVLIEGERIRWAGRQADLGLPDGPIRRFDVPDGTIVPGLIDTHTHLTLSATDRMVQEGIGDDDVTATVRAVENARAALRAGLTTVRDCGSRHHLALRVREAIERGLMPGPRLLLCGNLLTTTGGHLAFVGQPVDEPDDIPRAVRQQVQSGADFIKVTGTGGGLLPGNPPDYLQFDADALARIVHEATRLGVHVAVHCLSPAGTEAVIAGVPRTVEHLTFTTDGGGATAYDGSLVDRLVERGIVGSQVIVGWHRRAHGAFGALRADLPDQILDDLAQRIEVLQDMRRRGLTLLAGSDAGMPRTPFDNFGLILDLSVRHIGLTLAGALHMATSAAAAALGLTDRGVLEPGRLADIAVLRGDPFAANRAFYGAALTLVGGEPRWQAGEGPGHG